MNKLENMTVDTELDLVLERVVDVSREIIWQAWTQPEYLKEWFAPKPWLTIDCEIELRPGGIFYTVMQSPDGQEYPNAGCYLEIIPHEKLVFTNALAPGYRPAENAFFTAVITLDETAEGTLYKVVAMHKDQASRKQHEEMGFHEGWTQCLDQLVALAKTL